LWALAGRRELTERSKPIQYMEFGVRIGLHWCHPAFSVPMVVRLVVLQSNRVQIWKMGQLHPHDPSGCCC
jgi:hypothetical protein